MSNEDEPQTSVTLTVSFVPFGEVRLETQHMVEPLEQTRKSIRGLYSFPDETMRIEPSSLTNNDVMVV